MRKRLVSIAFVVLALPTLGGMAYAAAQSVGTRPAPQVVIPQGSEGHGGTPSGDDAATGTVADTRGRDDGVAHDANDDRRPTSSAPTSSAPPTSAVPTTVNRSAGADDGPGHDVGDDRGGVRTTVTTTVAGEDRGSGGSRSGSGRSSGSSDSGKGGGRG